MVTRGRDWGLEEWANFFFFSLNIKNYSNKKKYKETVNDFCLLIKQHTLFPPTALQLGFHIIEKQTYQ